MGCGASTSKKAASSADPELKEEAKPEPVAKEEPKAETPGLPMWNEWYSALGCVLIKDESVDDCIDFLTREGETQVKVEKRAPTWTVLKTYEAPREEGAGKQVLWLATFEDKDAYYTEHRESQKDTSLRADFMGSVVPKMQNGNPMVDMAGGYMGPFSYLSWKSPKAAGLDAADLAAEFGTLSTYRLKDEAAADELYAKIKAEVPSLMQKQDGKLVHVFVYRDGDGEMPGPDKLKLHIALLWKSADAMAAADAGRAALPDLTAFLDGAAADGDAAPGLVRSHEFTAVDHKVNLEFWGLA